MLRTRPGTRRSTPVPQKRPSSRLSWGGSFVARVTGVPPPTCVAAEDRAARVRVLRLAASADPSELFARENANGWDLTPATSASPRSAPSACGRSWRLLLSPGRAGPHGVALTVLAARAAAASTRVCGAVPW